MFRNIYVSWSLLSEPTKPTGVLTKDMYQPVASSNIKSNTTTTTTTTHKTRVLIAYVAHMFHFSVGREIQSISLAAKKLSQRSNVVYDVKLFVDVTKKDSNWERLHYPVVRMNRTEVVGKFPHKQVVQTYINKNLFRAFILLYNDAHPNMFE